MKPQSKFDTGRYFRIISILCIILLASFSVVFVNGSSNHDTFPTSKEIKNSITTNSDTLMSGDSNDNPSQISPKDGLDTFSNARDGGDRAMKIDLWDSSDLIIYGNASSDMEYGSIAKGDVNGDNIDDLIIGTSVAGIGLNRTMGGEVYVVFGAETISDQDYINLNGTDDTFTTAHYDIKIYGGEKDDYAGSAVAAADFNGDNIDDIIIGVRGADGLNNIRASCGEIHIIWGKYNFPEFIDLNTTTSFTHADHIIYGVDPYDSIGERITSGYVNNDIYEDLCLGVDMAYSKDNTKPLAGETYVIYGDTTMNLGSSKDLNTSTNYLTIYGNDTLDRSGMSVCLSDIDNDGKDDIIIGAPESSGYNNNFYSPGECYIIYGDSKSKLNQTGTNKMEWDLNVQPANVIFYGLNDTETFGSTLTSGDIDNDTYPDLLIGVNDGDGPTGSDRLNSGKVYLYYGRPRSTEDSIIVNTSFENVTVIYGAEANDNSAEGLAIADLDKDGFGDIIIGATAADSYNNNRFDAGEVYIIYGSDRTNIGSIIDLNIADNTYSTKHYDKIIYGRRFNDGLGRKLFVSDVNSDALPDLVLLAPRGMGYQNIPPNVGNVHVLFGKPTIIIENVTLINGDGPNQNTCYARYDNYTFEVNVTANKFKTDLEQAKVTLAPNSNNELIFTWNRSNDKFSSANYPYAYLTNESYSQWIDGKNIWSLYFKVIFNWSYQYESLTHCYVSSFRYDLVEFFQSFQYIFKVENDLDFYGNFSIIGEYQGFVFYGDWVRGGEQLIWDRQKVVYDNTIDIYPSNDEFNVTLWNTKNERWDDGNSSGLNYNIIMNVGNDSNPGEFYILNITGIPFYSCHGTHYVGLSIDGDNVNFTNVTPSNRTWQNSKIVTCGVTITDINGSNVDATSIEYRMSKENGKNWYPYPEWASPGLNGSFNGTNVDVLVQAEFDDGMDNVIVWRAKDVVGNGYAFSEKFNISIDTQYASFWDPIPSFKNVQPTTEVICGITIKDTLSGVDAKSIQYSISTSVDIQWSGWKSAQKTEAANEIQCLITEQFLNGDKNYIRWRAMDIAGNGYNESEPYWIRINTGYDPDAPYTLLSSPRDGYTINNLKPTLRWYGFDPNNDDIKYDLYLSPDRNLVKNQEASAKQNINDQTATTFIPLDLTDKNTYYWWVIPDDGLYRGRCNSGIWSFSVDTTVAIPKINLMLPFNGSLFNVTNVDLYWRVQYSGSDFVKYNIFWSNTTQLIEPKVVDHMSMSYTLADLDNHSKYYWTIIPYAGIIEGECTSGVFWFETNTDFVKESLISIDGPELIELWQGENGTYDITVTNGGNALDEFELTVDPGELHKDNVTLLNDTLYMDIDESKNTILKISIPESMPPLETNITITVKSRGVGDRVSHTIKVIVHMETDTPKPPKKPDDQIITIDETSIMLIFEIIIIILIIIIALMLIRKKIIGKKEPEGDEAEEEEEEEAREDLLAEGEEEPAPPDEELEAEPEPEPEPEPEAEGEAEPEPSEIDEEEEMELEDFDLDQIPEGLKIAEPISPDAATPEPELGDAEVKGPEMAAPATTPAPAAPVPAVPEIMDESTAPPPQPSETDEIIVGKAKSETAEPVAPEHPPEDKDKPAPPPVAAPVAPAAKQAPPPPEPEPDTDTAVKPKEKPVDENNDD